MTSIDAVQKLVEEARQRSFPEENEDYWRCVAAQEQLRNAAPQLAQALVEAWRALELIAAEDEGEDYEDLAWEVVASTPPRTFREPAVARTTLARLREMELGT